MVNKPMWDTKKISKFCKFTKGKELVELSEEEKLEKVNDFFYLIKKNIDNIME